MNVSRRMSVASRRTGKQLIAEGIGSVDLRQRMTASRRATGTGSIAGDWRKVADDLKRSVLRLKHELESA